MLRICLVEDEEYALKSLEKKIIDLNGPYEVVSTAYNGLDALDAIAKTYPDVVITDICMPDMDGIELLEIIDTYHKNIFTFIISGYQDFEYAKRAIQLGAEDYLLKPVVPQELCDRLQKCGNKVNSIRNNQHIEDLLSEVNPIQRMVSDYYLNYLIIGNPLSNPESVIHPNGVYVPSQQIEQKLKQLIPEMGLVLCFIGVYSNEKVIAIQKGTVTENILKHKLNELAAALEHEYKHSVTISYKMTEKTDRIDEQINLIRNIAIQSVLPGTNSVVSEMLESEYVTRHINDFISFFALYIRQAKFDALNDKIHDLFAEWQAHNYPLSAVRNDLIYIMNSLMHSLPRTDNLKFTVTYYVENIISISSTYKDLANQFYHFIVGNYGSSSDNSDLNQSPEQLIEEIEQYFHSNLSNNITLSMLCSEMNYSKAHLCRVFKEHKNMTPIDYFVRLKIEQAKTVIQECPSMPIKEIADSLGFSDSYYFSRVFKRITGRPPTAVREEKT